MRIALLDAISCLSAAAQGRIAALNVGLSFANSREGREAERRILDSHKSQD